MPGETTSTLADKGWGGFKKAGTGSPTQTSLGFAGSGLAGSSDGKTEALQSQLSGGMALQRRTMAELGAGEISKQQAKINMGKAMDRIRASALGIATLDPTNVVKGTNIMDSSGRAMHDAIMRNVTGARGSNMNNIVQGILRSGQNIGGRTIGDARGFVPYTGQDMSTGYRRAYPISYYASTLPEKLASKTLWGNLLKSIGSGVGNVTHKLLPTGITESKVYKDFINKGGNNEIEEISTTIEDIKNDKKKKVNELQIEETVPTGIDNTSFDLVNQLKQGIIPQGLSSGDYLVAMQILRDMERNK